MTTGKNLSTKLLKLLGIVVLFVVIFFLFFSIHESFQGYSITSVDGFYCSNSSSNILNFENGRLRIYSTPTKFEIYQYTLKDGYIYIDEEEHYLITKGGLVDEKDNVFYQRVDNVQSIKDFN